MSRFVAFALLIGMVSWSCKDLGDALPILRSLTVSASSITLAPGASQAVTISGGTPPFEISQRPDSTVATATLTNQPDGTASLQITAVPFVLSADTTIIKVRDSSDDDGQDIPTHRQEVSIRVIVSATPAVSFSSQVRPIFTARCVNAGCHPGGGAPFALNASAYTNLVDVRATSSCTSEFRVQRGNAAASVLYKKIAGTACGERMPLGGTPLPQSEIDVIRDWINQGAANN